MFSNPIESYRTGISIALTVRSVDLFARLILWIEVRRMMMSIEKARLITSSLVLLSVLISVNASAQDVSRWGLPEGAAMRLGKGALIGPVAYSPDGARLAVASSLGIWFYDTTTFQEIALLDESTAWVENMAFSPDGSTLATVRWDGIYLWDAVTGVHKQTLERIKSRLAKPGVQSGWRNGCVRELWRHRPSMGCGNGQASACA